MNNSKFKDFVKKNKFLIIESTVLATVAIVTYTYTCKQFGYVMVKPIGYNDERFFVKTPSGKKMSSLLTPYE